MDTLGLPNLIFHTKSNHYINYMIIIFRTRIFTLHGYFTRFHNPCKNSEQATDNKQIDQDIRLVTCEADICPV